MNLLVDIPLYNEDGLAHAVVEVPRGCAVKLKYEPALESFVWSRGLPFGLTFPYDFGFFPRTLGEDGDALDALVYTEVGSYPGVVVPGRVIGALRVVQRRGSGPDKRNDRLILVPAAEHRRDGLVDAVQLPERVREEIEAFFTASLALTGKRVRFDGWASAAEAMETLRVGNETFERGAE